MNRQPHASSREVIVANAIQDLVGELRLVDAADYIAFLKLEQIATLSDIVGSASELFFMPGTIRLGHGGEAHVGWTEPPRIVLDLELCPGGATVYLKLTLTALTASVEVNYVSFEKPDPSPARNTDFLKAALEKSRIRRSEPVGLR